MSDCHTRRLHYWYRQLTGGEEYVALAASVDRHSLSRLGGCGHQDV